MKILISIFLFFSFFTFTKAQIQSDPELVVLEIFKAAQTGDFDKLNTLCAPGSQSDGDVKKICNLKNESIEFQEKFKSEFKKGRIHGKPVIKNGYAEVKILFGESGRVNETILLVKRENLWYLFSM